MSRVIKIDSTGKDRNRLIRSIVLAVREMARQDRVTQDARDQAAFIALALQTIEQGIDSSVAAWEKRDYWVKADRFRMEWRWVGELAQRMRTAVLEEDWAGVAALSAQIGQRFGRVVVSEKHRLGQPWTGAYARLAARDE